MNKIFLSSSLMVALISGCSLQLPDEPTPIGPWNTNTLPFKSGGTAISYDVIAVFESADFIDVELPTLHRMIRDAELYGWRHQIALSPKTLAIGGDGGRPPFRLSLLDSSPPNLKIEVTYVSYSAGKTKCYEYIWKQGAKGWEKISQQTQVFPGTIWLTDIKEQQER